MAPLRLTFFTNSITYGGMEVHLITLARALQEIYSPEGKIAITTVIPEEKHLDRLAKSCQALSIPVLRLTLIGDQPPGERLRNLFKLSSWLRENRTDILHQHRTGPFHGKWAAVAARLAGTHRVIATEHNAVFEEPSFTSHLVNDATDHLLDKIIVVSEENRKRQVDLARRDPAKLTRIYPGIDFGRLAPLTEATRSQKREQLGIPKDAPLVGTASRLVKEKGVSTFIQALAQACDRDPDIHALIAGEGEEAENLVRECQRLGLSSRITFAGFRRDVVDLIGCLDVFVIPSIYEAFGMVAVEAMAMKIPVVATAVGGLPEIVIDQHTGLLVPPEDPSAMASAICRLLQDRSLAEACREQAYKHSYECFNHKRTAVETFSLYESLLSG